MTNRKYPGMLTDDDRAFLLDFRLEDRDRRFGIRNRLTEAVIDFSYVMGNKTERDADGVPVKRSVGEGLAQKDLDRVFEPDEDSRAAFDNGLVDLVSVLYLGCVGRTVGFETVLKRGVRQAEQTLAESDALGVDVDFEVTRRTVVDRDWERITRLVERGELNQLTESELRDYMSLYQQSGDFDPKRPQRYVQERIQEFEAASNPMGTRAENAREAQRRKKKSREDGRRGN